MVLNVSFSESHKNIWRLSHIVNYDTKIVQKIGTTGKGTYYTLMKKGLTKGRKRANWAIQEMLNQMGHEIG